MKINNSKSGSPRDQRHHLLILFNKNCKIIEKTNLNPVQGNSKYKMCSQVRICCKQKK